MIRWEEERGKIAVFSINFVIHFSLYYLLLLWGTEIMPSPAERPPKKRFSNSPPKAKNIDKFQVKFPQSFTLHKAFFSSSKNQAKTSEFQVEKSRGKSSNFHFVFCYLGQPGLGFHQLF